MTETTSGTTTSNDHAIERGELLIKTLASFNVKARICNIIKSSSVTVYEIKLEPGTKISKLKNLTADLELNLAVNHIRIIPIPSNLSIGVEVPNINRNPVYFKDIVREPNSHRIPFYLGKDTLNRTICIDISKTPHLLIAGATGSGKSVCINNLVCSILLRKRPEEVKLILVDPKVVELSIYNNTPHLIGNVITDYNETLDMLDALIFEMGKRYKRLQQIGVRNIQEYNNRSYEKMAYIVLVMDEFADFMANDILGMEGKIARLTAMARAVGIHLVLATQRPSADVITGLIKANIPSRISFQVSSSINSRIILDKSGAEKLIGSGDMLLSLSTEQDFQRIQGAYMTDNEIEQIVKNIKQF